MQNTTTSSTSAQVNDLIDPVAAQTFLRTLDPKGRHTVVAMEPRSIAEIEAAAKRGKRLAPMKLHGMSYRGDENLRGGGHLRVQDFVNIHARQNQYYHVNTPSEDASDLTKCTDEDISHIRGAFLDFDLRKDLLDPSKYDEATIEANWQSERARIGGIAEELRVSATPPTVVIDSGGGCQALWLLSEMVPVTAETHKQFDQIMENLLAAHPAADRAVRDLSRVLRLPGSVNVKRRDRLRAARVFSGNGPRFTISELLYAWPMVAMTEATARGSRTAVRARDPEVDALVATITDEPPQGLLARLDAEVGALGRLWRVGEDAVPGEDKSGSRCRWQLARQMRRASYSCSDGYHAASAWPASEGANAWGRVDWVRAWCDVARRDGDLAGGGGAFEAVAEDDYGAIDAGFKDDIDAALAAAFEQEASPAATASTATVAAVAVTTAAGFKRGRIVVDPARPIDAAAEVARYLRQFRQERGDNLVQQGGRLLTMGEFEVIVANDAGEPIRRTQRGLIEVSRARLEQIAVERNEWFRQTEEGEKPTRVPGPVIDALLDPTVAGTFGFEPCIGAAEGPLVDRVGNLRTTAGLDASGLWQLAGHDVEPLPDSPSRADALAAQAELEDLISEFKFAGSSVEEQARNKAVALVAMLTCVMRPNLDYAPAFLFDAPTPGSGKSMLTQLVAAFATSSPVPMAVTSGPEEFDKRLNTMILNRPSVVAFDNVTGTLGGDTLNSCLTAEAVQIRIFGKLEERSVPIRFTLLVNGNNVRVRDDMARRAVVCRLDTGMERPETRRFMKDPVRLVRQRRAHYVRAAALIIKAFTVSGAKIDVTLAGYEQWVAACVAPIVWLGYPNAVETQDALRAGDEERQTAGALLASLHDAFGEEWFSATTLASVIEEEVHTLPRPESASAHDAEDEPDLIDVAPLRAAMLAIVGSTRSAAKAIGTALTARRDRPHEGLTLRRSPTRQREGGYRWRVERAAA